MDKVTKIVAILVLIVSVGFLFFAAKSIDRIEMQKNLINSLQENIASLSNTVNSLSATLESAKGEISSLRTLAAQLRQDIEKATADKEKAEKALAEAKKENQKLTAELRDANAKISMLTVQLEQQTQEKPSIPITDDMPLEMMVTELARKLKETESKLSTAKDQLATLESLGILLEKESPIAPGDGIPQVVKEVEGKILDIKPSGVVSINFKGSIKPQKGATFYIADSQQVKARLSLEEIYNTILVAHMDIEKQDYDIKSGDNVNLILWTEE